MASGRACSGGSAFGLTGGRRGLQKFERCVGELRASGQGFLVPEDRGVHGIGHSNGALLHLLIGATAAPPNASNVLLSFNNKRAPPSAINSGMLFARRQPPAARCSSDKHKGGPGSAGRGSIASASIVSGPV